VVPTTNLVHNAIVHNLPEQGTVWVTTSLHSTTAALTVENTGEKLTPPLVATLAEPFQRGSKRIRTDGTLTPVPRDAGGLYVKVQLPAAPRHTGG
jgi:two-component system sensor histidine kinase VanS